MIRKTVKSGILFLCLFLTISVVIPAKDSKPDRESEYDRRAKGIESKADRKFVQQDFDKAMPIYEQAFKDAALSPLYSAQLHLKVARLYLTLLDYTAAIPHYDVAMTLSEDLLKPSDVCNYLDALRYSGQKMKAISVARRYAYRDAYHSDQRYQNILHALNYGDGFMPIGVPEFSVRPVETANTGSSEFWIGRVQDEYFYASSSSRFHDPYKKFYHRTRYYPLVAKQASSDKKEKSLLDKIPAALQNGPLSLSRDLNKMIITGVSYEKGESIGITGQGINAFQTKLYYSSYNNKRKGWSSFSEAFPQKQGASYSHPFLFDNDRSLLFASDMPGGYGGYDIYVAHWDERQNAWGAPINLGPQVNTEGDEISPALLNTSLIFASNGHVGFGGYDIYSIAYEYNQVIHGSLMHFGYPINTVANDFSMLHIDSDRGYIISDRVLDNKDDLFYFERNSRFSSPSLLFGMSESQSIASNVISLPTARGEIDAPRNEQLPKQLFTEHMLTLYFDFDRSDLRPSALQELNSWTKYADFDRIESLTIEGYADEIGAEGYNLRLSQLRAETVRNWLASLNVNVKVTTAGRGSTSVDELTDDNALHGPVLDGGAGASNYPSLWNSRVWMNREARRVDITATINK